MVLSDGQFLSGVWEVCRQDLWLCCYQGLKEQLKHHRHKDSTQILMIRMLRLMERFFFGFLDGRCLVRMKSIH